MKNTDKILEAKKELSKNIEQLINDFYKENRVKGLSIKSSPLYHTDKANLSCLVNNIFELTIVL